MSRLQGLPANIRTGVEVTRSDRHSSLLEKGINNRSKKLLHQKNYSNPRVLGPEL
jgi:hypothetical protein